MTYSAGSFNEVVSGYYSFIVGDSQIEDNEPFQLYFNVLSPKSITILTNV